MSERPVPRRESPWGVTGGPHPEPKAHRCNDRIEDIIYGYCAATVVEHSNWYIICYEALFEGNPFKTIPGPFRLFMQCMRSNPGEEPTEPFFYLDLEPPKRQVKSEPAE